MRRFEFLFVLAWAAPAHADPVAWETRAALGNDLFTSLTRPFDDLGFTNDFALAVRRRDGDWAFGGSAFHRMLTARTSKLRWDLVELAATAERTWPHRIVTDAWVGPTMGGNFGGLAIQNWWHGFSGLGRTIAQGLQNTVYDGRRRIAGMVGTSAAIETGCLARAYSRVVGQAALGGTGVTRGELAGGGRLVGHYKQATFELHGELALTGYHVVDPNLALPGGYRGGPQLEWRLGFELAWARYHVSYEYRANEGGSGEPIGVIAFEVR